MIGCEMRGMDEWTLSLLTNSEVLDLLKNSSGARQVMRTSDSVVWRSFGNDGSIYAAFFNTSFAKTTPSVSFMQLGIRGKHKVRDLWAHEDIGTAEGRLSASLNPHGAVLYKLSPV
jgi:hypothetical protein